MHKGSTLSEVAKAAGVSVITASRAIRGNGYVSEATRQRVLEAAEKLSYTPDMLARRMRGERSNLIGVFVHSFGSMVIHELITSISREARRLNFDLVVFSAESFVQPGRLETSDMLRRLCDGLIMILPNGADPFLKTLEQRSLPCVLVNYAAHNQALPIVVVDNRGGARAAVDHLVKLGHRRIAFIAGTSGTGQSPERQRGYTEALAAAHIEVDEQLIEQGSFRQAGGFAAAQRLLELPEPPTAIFCANDEMAFGALDAVKSKGLRVPDDVSIMGFDDIPNASFVFPPLSTIRQPYVDMGVRAMREVVEMLNGRPVGPSRMQFPTELVVRQSTGPAPVRDGAAA
jgi:LacI family transcriptional regulator